MKKILIQNKLHSCHHHRTNLLSTSYHIAILFIQIWSRELYAKKDRNGKYNCKFSDHKFQHAYLWQLTIIVFAVNKETSLSLYVIIFINLIYDYDFVLAKYNLWSVKKNLLSSSSLWFLEKFCGKLSSSFLLFWKVFFVNTNYLVYDPSSIWLQILEIVSCLSKPHECLHGRFL